MKRCGKCRQSASRAQWPRYASTGKLTVYCSTCNAQVEAHREANAQAKARGYANATHTPEFKRVQREQAAAIQGRVLPEYTAREERQRLAMRGRLERAADQRRTQFAWSMVFAAERLWHAERSREREVRDAIAAASRVKYQRHLGKSRSKVALYKATHVHVVTAQHRRRQQRIEATADGTLTPYGIQQMKASATECAYCAEAFPSSRHKHTDHMVALCHDGPHQAHNVVVCCPSCNGRKAALTYGEWFERVAPEHRGRTAALWISRYGETPLPFRFFLSAIPARVA